MKKNIGSVSEYQECYLFFPSDFWLTIPESDEKIRLFYDKCELLDDEKKMVEGVRKDIDKNYEKSSEAKVYIDKLEDTMQLRFIHHYNNDIKKASKAQYDYSTFYSKLTKTDYDYNRADEKEKAILNSGAFYTYGRDSFLRPINIFNIEKLEDLLEENADDSNINAIHKFYDYIVNLLLLEKQIENFITIIDFSDCQEAHEKTFMEALKFVGLDNPNITSRRCKVFLYNISLKIEEIVIPCFSNRQKLNIHKIDENSQDKLWEFVNKSQIEKKYGGQARNLSEGEYWTPGCPGTDFFLSKSDETSKLITKDDYIKKYEKGELTDYKISSDLLPSIRWKQEFLKSRSVVDFGPSTFKQSGIMKKSNEDDDFDLIFSEYKKPNRVNEQKTQFAQVLEKSDNKKGAGALSNLGMDITGKNNENFVITEEVATEIFNDSDVKYEPVSFNKKNPKLDLEVYINQFTYKNTLVGQFLNPQSCKLNIRKRNNPNKMQFSILLNDFIGVETNADLFEEDDSEIPIKEGYHKLNVCGFQEVTKGGYCGGTSSTITKRELKSYILYFYESKQDSNKDSDLNPVALKNRAEKRSQKILKSYSNTKKIVMKILQYYLRLRKCSMYEQNLTPSKWQKQALAIINPECGLLSKGGKELYDSFYPYLTSNGFEITEAVLENDDEDVPPQGRQFEEHIYNMSNLVFQSYHMVFVFGGDGTVHEVINGFCRRKDNDQLRLKLACFSCGKNNFIGINQACNYKETELHSMNLNTLYSSTRAIFKKADVYAYQNEGTPREIFGINQLTLGINAEIFKAFDEHRTKGTDKGYNITKKTLIKNAESYDVKIYASKVPVSAQELKKNLICETAIYDFSFNTQPLYNSHLFSLSAKKFEYLHSDELKPGNGKISFIKATNSAGKLLTFDEIKKLSHSKKDPEGTNLEKAEILQTQEANTFKIEMNLECEFLVDGEKYKGSSIQATSAGVNVYLLA